MVLFHSTFLPPFIQYSIVPAGMSPSAIRLNQPVPGVASGKLMHDFGVSSHYTVLIDCPVSLDPLKVRNNESAVEYNPQGRTRLGVFPRHAPDRVRWHDTSPCIVIHTANTWDEDCPDGPRINLLLCRENSLAPLYTMGCLTPPENVCAAEPESRLYYYEISHAITQQWALSVIPFEFPHVPRHREMRAAQFIYGCSMTEGNFSSAYIAGIRIDCLVKVNAKALIQQGKTDPPPQIHGAVDTRSIHQIIESTDPDDVIQVFKFPSGWYAQECSFVPRHEGHSEDDGWVVTYVFDESQLDEYRQPKPDACSELWIIDARSMKDVVARIVLPQRVPYGMHGNWFPEDQIKSQRGYRELRTQ
ncbi:uncharacterized protein LDX57_006953 [Aspergillus melleus]|uniref:uncharacterized protein n=1 Tax=Aspergillus melleus TaxID=138277 RepID=UPI001E8ECD4B|nr:uncharacterized protein LDX57_006953 [Aspergillus melleus]KAH8429286.1 hypothetical protein LDX57_006953 [Aspergillus melleus]